MNDGPAFKVWLERAGGEQIPIRGSCFLGRAASCHVVVENTKASRQHALIYGQENTEYWLIDLGSANGTFLNGRRITQPCRLSDQDQVSIAGVTITFMRPAGPPRLLRNLESSISQATVHEIQSLNCWLLIGDIEGSTQLLRRLSTEDAPRKIGLWLSACARIVDEHEGGMDKFTGDGFFAYWPDGPRAAEAVATAITALKALQDQSDPQFRLIVHFGKVAVGNASPSRENLSGQEVTFSFRVEKLAAVLGLPRLVSESARAGLENLLATIPAGSHSLPGFEGEFPFYTF